MAMSLGLGGCVLAPPGTTEEQAKLEEVSPNFEPPVEARQLPPLPAPAGWRDVLRRAFFANGELESAYFEWKAALARIDQAATWPNTKFMPGFSYDFSREKKGFNRVTISGGFMPSVTLQLPIKTQAAGEVALEAAREAGEKFRAVEFDLRKRVLLAYLDLALAEEKVRIQHDNLNLFELLKDSAAARAQAGGPLQDLLKAVTDTELAENELRNAEAEAKSVRGTLNDGMLARDPGAPLVLPPVLPAPRHVGADDARLIAAAVDQNPELAGLARRVAGRKDAVELARLEFLPDFVPSGSITGNVDRVVETFVMLPTTAPAILATIRDAESMTRSSEAVLRQTAHDRAASFVANLVIMRNAERQTKFYQRYVAPSVRQLIDASRQEYAAGTISLVDLIDSERTYIGVRLTVAQARIEREKRLAELEALAGVDIETLDRPAAQQAALAVP